MKHDRRLHQSIERTKAKRPAQGSANADNGTSGRPKREMTVQQALEWAFRVEKAQLELPPRPDSEVQEAQDYGLEYILIRQAQVERLTVFITHGHADHYLGLADILAAFPDARVFRTAATATEQR